MSISVCPQISPYPRKLARPFSGPDPGLAAGPCAFHRDSKDFLQALRAEQVAVFPKKGRAGRDTQFRRQLAVLPQERLALVAARLAAHSLLVEPGPARGLVPVGALKIVGPQENIPAPLI